MMTRIGAEQRTGIRIESNNRKRPTSLGLRISVSKAEPYIVCPRTSMRELA
jgi:hypothetical protein